MKPKNLSPQPVRQASRFNETLSAPALPVLSIVPGATRSRDEIVIFDAQNHAVPVPCSYMNFESLEAMRAEAVSLRVSFLELEPLAENDPLVQAKVTSYVALGDASVYKMVQVCDNLIYVRKLPVMVRPEVMAQCRALRSPEPDVLPDVSAKDEGLFSRSRNFLRVRGG